MPTSLSRRCVVASAAASLTASLAAGLAPVAAQDRVRLRFSGVSSSTDARAVALLEAFAPAVAGFADFEAQWNATLFAQGAELEAIARGDLEMSLTSAQELAFYFPEFSIFTAGYVHRDAAHQVAVFDAPLMEPFKRKVETDLGVKLLNVMYLGRRQVNLRMPRSELEVRTPADLQGVNLRMPSSDAWQFLGSALGADPTPMPFVEVYAALMAGTVDGQDNPLPTVVDAKFYQVTRQIVLTSHLVDLNYLALSQMVWDAMTVAEQATVQAAADAAAEVGRQLQLDREAELAGFLTRQDLEIYEPDIEAFRSHVQAVYLESDFAKDWPAGLLEVINAL